MGALPHFMCACASVVLANTWFQHLARVLFSLSTPHVAGQFCTDDFDT